MENSAIKCLTFRVEKHKLIAKLPKGLYMANKAKTNKGASKRFRANGAGTMIKRRRSGRNRILTKNSQDQKRRLRCQNGVVSSTNVLRVVKLLKKKVVSVIKKK